MSKYLAPINRRVMMAKQEVQAAAADGLLPWQQGGHLDQAVFQLWFACRYYIQELADYHKLHLPVTGGFSLKAYLAEGENQFREQGLSSGELQELVGLIADTSSWLAELDNAFKMLAEPMFEQSQPQSSQSSSDSLAISVVDISADNSLNPRAVDCWIKAFQQVTERHRNGMQEY